MVADVLPYEKMKLRLLNASHQALCYTGMLVGLEFAQMFRRFGSERMIVNGSADWGVSDPLSLPKVVQHMQAAGNDALAIQRIVFDNAMAFYGASPRWKPRLDLTPMDVREFQR